MSRLRDLLKMSNRVSLFVLSLIVFLIILVVGLFLADRSLLESTDRQATLDATISAQIVAEEVKLAGEYLYELGAATGHHGDSALRNRIPGAGQREAIWAVWLLDTAGTVILDSASWRHQLPQGADLSATVMRMAREVSLSRDLQLRGLGGQKSAGGAAGHYGQALLAEPIVEDSEFTGIAVALVDEGMLLAPAESTAVEGRSFLALLVDGDTVAQIARQETRGRQSAPARLPLPGNPSWFVVSGHTPRAYASRIAIWILGGVALLLLSLGLIRERRQTVRIAERSLELERLSAELLRANRMKSEFLANVSHELRTPLNAIVGFVDLLRDGGYGDLSERQISPVERVATSAARLRTLVDQVLDIAKIAAGRLDVRLETIAVRAFLGNVVSEIEPLVREKRLAVRISTCAEIPRIRTDPTHLRQILINLLGNAVKYTKRGGIELRTRLDENGPPPRSVRVTGQHVAFRPNELRPWLAIEVADTGIGIAGADLERIFDEFEQVRARESGDPENRGTGLGLAISRRLATLLGGDVTVESSPGTGSTFTIWLPARE